MKDGLSPQSGWLSEWPGEKLFLLSFLTLALCFTLLVKVVLILNNHSDLSFTHANESARVQTAAGIMQAQVQSVITDLLVLANSPETAVMITRDTPAARQQLAQLFSAFSSQKKIYDQIRYMDNDGREVVRVNLADGQPVVVADEALQDKQSRYYFTGTSRLQAGQVYVSPLDLNIENSLIEVPYKPMLRLGTPLFNGQGKRVGMLMLNMYGSVLLDRFRRIMGDPSRAILLNQNGDWLVAPDARMEWGFMFGNPAAFTHTHKAAWEKISRQESGHLHTAAGLFSFATVRPLRSGQNSAAEPAAGDYFWKTVSLVPPEQLPSDAIFRSPLTTSVFLLGLVFLALLSAYLTHVIVGRRRLHGALKYSSLQYKEIMATLGEGVLVLDNEGMVLEMNPEAERLLGWSRSELVGQDAHALIHHHPVSGVSAEQCRIRKVALTGKPYRSEDEQFSRKNGSTFLVGVNAAPLTSGNVIMGSVLAFRDVTELKLQQEEIRHLAYHDTLTGLPNRRLLLDRMEQAVAQSLRHHRMLAIMFLDLDHFKEINDSWGHEGGDELLRSVASLLSWSVRDSDTVTRQGGDEFIILLPEIGSAENATEIAERILNSLNGPFQLLGREVRISASIGIAFCPDDADNVDSLLREADLAMYEAKQSGRNRYCLRSYGQTG